MTRTYKSINVTEEQQNFLKILDEYKIEIFSSKDLSSEIFQKYTDLEKILENLVHKKFIVRLENGKFCKANFNDENVIGCFLVPGGTISYWSALNKHALTEQFPNVLFIQSTKNKPDKTILGAKYKFIRVHPRNIAGILNQGYGNLQYRITDIEKTIIDCFDLPQYSGGYAELLRAFSQAKLNSTKLIECCTAINNIAITKRIGFLAELIDKNGTKNFVKYAQQMVNRKYNVFDPLGEDVGEFINEWKLRLNISRDDIMTICKKEY